MITFPRQARDRHRENSKRGPGLSHSDAHKQSARKAVAASAVLLQNLDDALPLPTTGLKKVAVRCEKRHLFLSFPYVCPEPVLAK